MIKCHRCRGNMQGTTATLKGQWTCPKCLYEIEKKAHRENPVGVVKDGVLRWTDDQGVEHSGPFIKEDA
jgi:DNA-directed RNA polymerase subunit M/transcription elongation factor TFIIS